MDDDKKNFPRKGGPKRFGGAAKGAGARDAKRPGPRDGGRPFAKPRSGERAQSGERREQREWKPRADAQDRPERAFRPRPAGDGEGRKPFVRRDEGERKPFVRRDEGAGGGKRGFDRKEHSRERRPGGAPAFKRDREGGDGAPGRQGARSFGMKSHEGQRRSYGMKSHERDSKPFKKRPEAVEEAAGERIAKRLARAGIASRRDAEDLIAAGRVTVNGRKLDSPAFNVMPDDTIAVDGTAIPAIERTRLFLFHKPAGVVTTNRDPEGRKTVFDTLPTDLPRLMTIGRLDINTEGLLLLTNDGGLARVLELPATGWQRRYRVRVHGKVDEKALKALKDGIAVDGVFYGSIEASLEREQGSNAWLSIGLREGKNREVKNILGALGLDVTRLIRVSYGPFQLGDLPEGHVQEIKGRMLREQLGERLIEEAGANFEAPIINQFSNQPVKREARGPEPLERPRVQRDGERGRIGEGGLIKKRHRREDARDRALGKLSTRPDAPFERGERPERPKLERGERPARTGKFGESPDRFARFADKPGARQGAAPRAGKKPEREQRPIEPPGQRKSNVWMAPGARPLGAGRAAAEKSGPEGRRGGKAHGKPGEKPAFGKPRGDRPTGDRPRGGKGGARGRDADRRR